MKPDEFDLQLMDEMSQLPPPAPEVEDYTPWQASIRKIIVGMVLITFRLEFFYLQYLLPLLGACLLYLGYRSLRKSDPWFTLCWGLSAFLLVFHMAWDVLTATPIMAWITQNAALNASLSALTAAANVLLLFALRAGIRRRFVSMTGESPGTGWAGGSSPTFCALPLPCGPPWSRPRSLVFSATPSPTIGSTMAVPLLLSPFRFIC